MREPVVGVWVQPVVHMQGHDLNVKWRCRSQCRVQQRSRVSSAAV